MSNLTVCRWVMVSYIKNLNIINNNNFLIPSTQFSKNQNIFLDISLSVSISQTDYSLIFQNATTKNVTSKNTTQFRPEKKSPQIRVPQSERLLVSYIASNIVICLLSQHMREEPIFHDVIARIRASILSRSGRLPSALIPFSAQGWNPRWKTFHEISAGTFTKTRPSEVL